MIQAIPQPRNWNPEYSASGKTIIPSTQNPLEGLETWIQEHPQLAFFGAVFLGVGLGWLLKVRK